MNQAAEMKSADRPKLPKPSLTFNPTPSRPSIPAVPAKTSKPSALPDEEVPFRTLVEEYVAEHNLLFVPLGKAHHVTRLPMFRIAQTIDGRGGITVYIMDDVVWALPAGGREEELFKPIGLDDLVLRATKAKK